MKAPRYNPKEVEPKWQQYWLEQGIYHADLDSKRKKFYALVEFPFPSGEGLHTGHIRGYTAMDILARKRRLEGYNVLYPIGWDAFGLPTENYAIKTGIHPAVVTKRNTDTFRTQLQSVGLAFDWSREVNTTDPEYYQWTQWIFLQLHKHGLAYKAKMEINWCPSCKIGLANEEAQGGVCERCGGPTEKREKEQWMLAITKYADRLDKDLDTVDYWDKIKVQQRNWIGRSEGAIVAFPIVGSDERLEVFTTRIDTIFSGTFLILAPEHPFIQSHAGAIQNFSAVQEYIREAKKKSDIDRTADSGEKNGVELAGVTVTNPATGESMPVWVSDFVLGHYGTGAVFADAHDERDFDLAKKYSIPLKVSIRPKDAPDEEFLKIENLEACYSGEGVLVHSGEFSGLTSDEARPKIIEWLEAKGLARKQINFKLRDWVFSRQRYWGEPIPMVRCKACGTAEAQTKFSINFYDESIWSRLLSGEKTIETRALNPEEPERYFGDIVVGDSIKFVHKKTGEEKVFRVKTVFRFANLQELLEKKELHRKILAKEYSSLESLAEAYEALAPGYAEKINQNGLVGWEVELVDAGKWVPLPESELPLELPKVETYTPTDTGESPLAAITDWVQTTCPTCGGPAERETDTMPNWAGSSWYFLRYTDPKNTEALASEDALKYWTPIDWYNGGMEHTTLHLLYSRFWHKFLYDIGVVPTSEPYQKRTSHGLILAEGGVKMSKSKGNVVNPDTVVRDYGADTLRVYEMFMGPFDQPVAWSTESIAGSRRFLEKVWKVQSKVASHTTQDADELRSLLHQTIRKVTEDIEGMRFNTAISALMILVNEMEKQEAIEQTAYETLLLLLSPFAPHITEELWHQLGHEASIFVAEWPQAEEKYLTQQTMEIVVQVGGKWRASFSVATDANEATVRAQAEADERVATHLHGKTIRKVIFVKNRLINFVV